MPGWLEWLFPNVTIEPPHDGEGRRAVEGRPQPSEA